MTLPPPPGLPDPSDRSDLRVGDWTLDPRACELRRDGEVQRLQPKMVEVLLVLARRAGEVVSKEELLAAVWPDSVVSDDALWRCVSGLRRLLGDDPASPEVIETIPKRGYRLLAPVRFGGEAERTATTEPPDPGDADQGGEPVPAGPPTRRRPLVLASLGLSLLALALTTWLVLGRADRPAEPPASTAESEPSTAHEITERARQIYLRLDPPSVEQAIALYHEAVDLDPGYAPAYAGLADAYFFKVVNFSDEGRFIEAARDAAERALELDPDLGAAHKAMASVHLAQGRLTLGVQFLRRTLELDPDHRIAANNLGVVLQKQGRLAEARQVLGRFSSGPDGAIVRLNLAATNLLLGLDDDVAPLLRDIPRDHPTVFPRAVVLLARLDYYRDRDDLAAERLERLLLEHPRERRALALAAEIALIQGRPQRAGDLLERAREPVHKWFFRPRILHAFWQLTEGREIDREAVERIATNTAWSLDEQGQERPELAHDHASTLAVLGQREAALETLERAVDLGFRDRRWLERDPVFAELRRDPAFGELLERIRAEVAKQRALLPSD